jgi:hypothetical protein
MSPVCTFCIDRERAFAQLRQLLVEHLGADAIAAVLRLIVSEREFALLRKRARRRHDESRAKYNAARKQSIS